MIIKICINYTAFSNTNNSSFLPKLNANNKVIKTNPTNTTNNNAPNDIVSSNNIPSNDIVSSNNIPSNDITSSDIIENSLLSDENVAIYKEAFSKPNIRDLVKENYNFMDTQIEKGASIIENCNSNITDSFATSLSNKFVVFAHYCDISSNIPDVLNNNFLKLGLTFWIGSSIISYFKSNRPKIHILILNKLYFIIS